MSAERVATALRQQAAALEGGHAGTRVAIADGLRRLAEDLEHAPAATDCPTDEELEELADELNEAWDALRRHVPGGSGPLADACLEAARLLRPSGDRSGSVAVKNEDA